MFWAVLLVLLAQTEALAPSCTVRSSYGAGKVHGRAACSHVLSSISTSSTSTLAEEDPEVHEILVAEYARQCNGIELIASENFCSTNVMTALGSCMTNKYSEGRPGARYYGGAEFIDQMEVLCQNRALSVFGLKNMDIEPDPNNNEEEEKEQRWGVNVQPYSGSPANFAVFTALLKPHDRVMGLDLPSGGHLTHGYQTAKRRVSATSIYFESMPYKVNPDTGLLDYDEMEALATAFRPKLLIAGASAYPRDWDYARMRRIADKVGAQLLCDMAHVSGLVATGEANSPFEHCDVVTSTTHKSLRGPRSGMIFYKEQLADQINNAVFPALQGGPHNHQIAALAVALKEAASPAFGQYIRQVKANAKEMAKGLVDLGYHVATGGTDNHIVLWDVRPAGLTGSQVDEILNYCHISANKNTLCGDTSALHPGGVRLGSPAMTTRGMVEADVREVVVLLGRAAKLAADVRETAKSESESADAESSPTPTTTTTTIKKKSKSKRVTMALFRQVLKREEFQATATTIREDVEKLAKGFPMPGLKP